VRRESRGRQGRSLCARGGWQERRWHRHRHGDGAADSLIGADDPHLVGRGDAGEHRCLAQYGVQLVVVPRVEVCSLSTGASFKIWSSSAIAAAVEGWSPVIMTTDTPAERKSATAAAAVGRTPSARPRKPNSSMSLTRSSASSERADAGRSATASTRSPGSPGAPPRRRAAVGFGGP